MEPVSEESKEPRSGTRDLSQKAQKTERAENLKRKIGRNN